MISNAAGEVSLQVDAHLQKVPCIPVNDVTVQQTLDVTCDHEVKEPFNDPRQSLSHGHVKCCLTVGLGTCAGKQVRYFTWLGQLQFFEERQEYVLVFGVNGISEEVVPVE